jgi:hypothetical protein
MTDQAAQVVANRSAIVNFPFVGKIDDKVVFWLVEPSGTWLADCELGERYARMFIKLITSGRTSVALLGWVVKGMISTGRFTGIECGFMGAIGKRLN